MISGDGLVNGCQLWGREGKVYKFHWCVFPVCFMPSIRHLSKRHGGYVSLTNQKSQTPLSSNCLAVSFCIWLATCFNSIGNIADESDLNRFIWMHLALQTINSQNDTLRTISLLYYFFSLFPFLSIECCGNEFFPFCLLESLHGLFPREKSCHTILLPYIPPSL